MKTFQLEGKSREVAATSADQKRALKAMRKNNEIPAVLYGGEKVSAAESVEEDPGTGADLPVGRGSSGVKAGTGTVCSKTCQTGTDIGNYDHCTGDKA